MAHKPTTRTRNKIKKLMGEGVSKLTIAKRLGVNYNTLKSHYKEELGLPIDPKEEDLETYIANPVPKEEVVQKIEKHQLTDTGQNVEITKAGQEAINALVDRVKNGIVERHIHYEYTAWDKDNKPIGRRPRGITEKVKSCSTHDIRYLIELTTNMLTFKEQELLRIQKEIHNIKDDTGEEKKETKYDYSKLSNEKLLQLKSLIAEATVNE